MFTDDDKLAEIERQIIALKRISAGFVARRGRKASDAARRLAILKAVADDYRNKGATASWQHPNDLPPTTSTLAPNAN